MFFLWRLNFDPYPHGVCLTNSDTSTLIWPWVKACQNPIPLVNVKISGTWMFIHPKLARHRLCLMFKRMGDVSESVCLGKLCGLLQHAGGPAVGVAANHPSVQAGDELSGLTGGWPKQNPNFLCLPHFYIKWSSQKVYPIKKSKLYIYHMKYSSQSS